MTDQQGSVRDLVQLNASTGITSVVDHVIYNSFGQVTSESDPSEGCLFKFTGRPTDSVTGLQNNLNRWYDPLTTNWISFDPTGFTAGDTNTCRYVGNNPVNATDPSGLDPGTPAGSQSSNDAEVDALLAKIDADLATANAQLKTADSLLASVQAGLAGLKASAANLDQKLAAQSAGIAQAQAESDAWYAQFQASMKSYGAELRALRSDLNKIGADIDAVTQALQKSYDGMHNALDILSLAPGYGAIPSAVHAIELHIEGRHGAAAWRWGGVLPQIAIGRFLGYLGKGEKARKTLVTLDKAGEEAEEVAHLVGCWPEREATAAQTITNEAQAAERSGRGRRQDGDPYRRCQGNEPGGAHVCKRACRPGQERSGHTAWGGQDSGLPG